MKKRILGIMLSVVMLSGCGAVANNNVPAMTYSAENEYMQLAIEEAREGIYNSQDTGCTWKLKFPCTSFLCAG